MSQLSIFDAPPAPPAPPAAAQKPKPPAKPVEAEPAPRPKSRAARPPGCTRPEGHRELAQALQDRIPKAKGPNGKTGLVVCLRAAYPYKPLPKLYVSVGGRIHAFTLDEWKIQCVKITPEVGQTLWIGTRFGPRKVELLEDKGETWLCITEGDEDKTQVEYQTRDIYQTLQEAVCCCLMNGLG